MPITLNCPKCHKPFRVRDESIGGRVRCPSCGSVLQVPAALSPASNFDDMPKSDSPDTVRPVAEDVRGPHGGTIHDIAMGGRAGAVDLGVPPDAPLPGPPSIKMQPAYQPPSSPPLQPRKAERTAAPVSLPKAPSPERAPKPAPPPTRPLSDEEVTWSKVSGGLGMIRLAMFLLALIFFAVFGQAVWVVFDYDRAWSDDPGLLKRADWPLKKEVFAAYTVGFGVPAALLLLIGRLRCGGAPPVSHARGLALGAAFFSLIAIAGAAVFVALTYFNLADKLGDKVKVPPQAGMTAVYAAVPSAILADILTMLFIGQIGWTLRRPTLQKSIAGFFVYAAILPAGILIGMQYYPIDLHVGGLGMEDDDTRRGVIWGVILLMGCMLFFLRYAGVAGQARRAIRKLVAGEA